MPGRRRLVIIFIGLIAIGVATAPLAVRFPSWFARPHFDHSDLRNRSEPGLRADLQAASLALGQPAFIRIFKEDRALEVWLQAGTTFDLFRTYEICNYSGDLGPKLKEGDRQSPEGFYAVDAAALNPNSRYHLSFNLGFPNAFDRAHGRTGSFLMVHGDCVSIGCYAMTDAGIEEIYLIVEAALASGQDAVQVHAFPFRMSEARLTREAGERWFGFWQNLKTGYDLFETDRVPPDVSVLGGAYAFRSGAGGQG